MAEVGVDPVEADLNQKFVERLLEVANVNVDEVEGTHTESLLDIIQDQAQMDGIMKDLRYKVDQMCRQFQTELKRGYDELHAEKPKLDEMKILRGERHIDVEDENLGHEDKMITRLRDTLKSETTTPDEVINVLTSDKFEKEKLKLQLQYMNGGSDDEGSEKDTHFVRRKQIALKRLNRMQSKQDMRFTERHIQQLKAQFVLPYLERNYKVLDIMLRHLRYIKRHETDVRQQIYRNAEYVEIPAQTIIFNKGDPADYMYIILKGRVSCVSTLANYSDIPIILATIKDGESFGELAVVDQDRIVQTHPS